MSLPTLIPSPPDALRRHLPGALLAALGLAIGFTLARSLDDPHAATAERLTGTVTWSNQQSRQIAFEADGEVRDPLDGDTMYYVTGGWEDADSAHTSAEYPACLIGKPSEQVSTERRRVELDVIHQDFGGPQQVHIATFVRCGD